MAGKSGSHFPFSHKLHVVENEIDCTTCHGDIPQAADMGQHHLPSQGEVCVQCHDGPIAGIDCASCHKDAATLAAAAKDPGVARIPAPQVAGFSHAAHVKRVDGDCATCHSAIKASTAPGDGHRPTMDVCMQCHQEDYDNLACGKCHADLSDPRFQPKLGRFSHQGDWLHRHGGQARTQGSATCAQCHAQTFCTDCHSATDNQVTAVTKWPRRTDRGLVHRGNYLQRHPIDARREGQTCLGCHRINSCRDCHERSGLRVVQSGISAIGGHPIVRVSAGGHDVSPRALSEIRANVVACAGCHESRAPVCLRCHSDATLRINPHPPGFKSSFGKTDRAVCKRCHRP